MVTYVLFENKTSATELFGKLIDRGLVFHVRECLSDWLGELPGVASGQSCVHADKGAVH